MRLSDYPRNLNNVWIYLRKSREDREAEERARQMGSGEFETLSRHRRALLELAHTHYHNVTNILEEIVSGEYISERPQVQKLLDAVDRGEVTAVWCMDIDRLGRGDMADQGRILRTFKESSTLILTPDKVYDLTDEMDEEWTEFKTFMARRELKMINKRMQRGRVASVREGKFIGTHPPFGYDVTKDLVLVQNSDADTVRLIFRLYTAEGMGGSRIAAYLNERGIVSPKGKSWRGESVMALLSNPVYAGWITWGRLDQDRRKGRYKRRPESEWIKAKGLHKSIVNEATFELVSKIRKSRTHAPVPKDRVIKNALAGIVVCGKCRYLMTRRPYGRQAPHLMCNNPQCNNKSTRLSIVEDRIISALSDWLAQYELSFEEVAAALKSTVQQDEVSKKLLNSIDDAITQVTRQRDELHDLLERRIYDADTYLERNQRLLSKLDELNRQRDKVKGDILKSEQLLKARHEIVPRVHNVIDAYQLTDDPEKRNALLKSVLNKVVYTKEKWQVSDQFKIELYPLI